MTQLLLSPWRAGQTVPADTVVFVPAGGPLTTWAQASTIVIAALLLALLVVIVLMMAQLYRLLTTSNRLLSDARKQMLPVTTRAQTLVDNLTYMSAVVREDLERVHDSVASLTARLNQASDRVEERIEEFNALLEVVQSEAEGLFIDTASTVRAVREEARAPSQPQTRGPDQETEET
jgi:uncharacterized protein YPO0396